MTLREFIRQRDKRTASAERRFEILIKSSLRESMKGVFEQVEQGNINMDLETYIKKEPIRKALRWLYVTWSYSYGKWFTGKYPLKDYDFWQAKLEELFEKEGAEKVSVIYATTIRLTKDVIKEAIQIANTGASIDEVQSLIQGNITKSGGAISPGRARTIARTEVISASNQASHESVKSMGLQTEKKWATGGMNIRDTHIAAAGQGWIKDNETFRVGSYQMQYPGDPAGGVEEIANCKCVLLYRVI